MSKRTPLRLVKPEEDTSFDELKSFTDTVPLPDFLKFDIDMDNENIDLDDYLMNCKNENEDNLMSQDMYNNLLYEIKDLKAENKITNSRIDNTNKVIAIVGGLIGLVLTVFIFASNSQYNAIKDINNSNMKSIQTEIKAINQQLDYQEQLNNLNIQNQVQKELKR